MDKIPEVPPEVKRLWAQQNGHALAYKSWQQVAGYTDGDGGLLLNPECYTISLGIDWADSFKPQLDGIRSFLLSEKVGPEKVYALGQARPVWHLRLSNQAGLMKALTAMLPFVNKKKDQVTAMIRYLANEMTGEELIEAFNEAVRVGTRSGYIRHVSMPYSHSQGVAKGRTFLSRGKGRRTVSTHVLNQVNLRKQNGMTMRDVSEEAGVSKSTIYRRLGDRKKAG